MQWLRLYSEARTDNKLRTLNDAQHRVWFNLLCYAGEQATRGEIHDCDEFMLAIECAGGDQDLLSETLRTLERLRIVRVTGRDTRDSGVTACDGCVITFVAWEERQYDKPSDRPEATAERKRRQREKSQSGAEFSHPQPKADDVSRDVTPGHAIEQNRTDTDTEQNRESSAHAPPKPKTKRATVMTDDWQPGVHLFEWGLSQRFDVGMCREETEKFRDHFMANGKPMKDWDAAWKNWMRRSREYGAARASPNGTHPEERRPAIPLFEGVERKQMSPEKLAEVRREVDARRAT